MRIPLFQKGKPKAIDPVCHMEVDTKKTARRRLGTTRVSLTISAARDVIGPFRKKRPRICREKSESRCRKECSVRGVHADYVVDTMPRT